MSYLEEFQTQINNRDFSKFLQLWEEYCTSDTVDADEFMQLLKSIKISDFAKLFGQFVETAVPLWQTITDEKESYDVLRLLIDLETSNSPFLADTAFEALKKKYGHQPNFNERLRLIGMRSKENVQGSISNFDLLAHMEKGKFVFHTGGWGTGEIIDISGVREQLAVEFENVAGRKHITFSNAFKTLIPLPDDHFLARRFADPDLLEKQAKEDPVEIIKVLLRDLGPKSAAEIKDELCELVIPDKEWPKWWQGTRARIKKDTKIETPATIKNPFKLRKKEVPHEERFQKSMHNKTDIDEIILTSYNFVRDLPNMLKKEEIRENLKEQLLGLLSLSELNRNQEILILLFLENQFSHLVENKRLPEYFLEQPDIEKIIHDIDIIAFKKRALMLIRDHRPDWAEFFLSLLFTITPSTLKDYILKELNKPESQNALTNKLKELLNHPSSHPEAFVWYFQKIVNKDSNDLPFSNKEGQCLFFESFLILFSIIESKPEYRELIKKMYTLLSGKRYAVVRSIIEGTDVEFLKEFLLLVSKCQSLSDHDMKILRSLAEVVRPELATEKSRKSFYDPNVIWTTEAGYLKIQDKARQIGTVEIVENAREIEAARALGDLRENSEYKFALEKRSRLQGELKTLSDQLKRARIITKDDISLKEVGIGNIVELQDSKNKKITYTILGPWDADPDAFILSFQSKLAMAMIGLKIDEAFQFRDEEYKIIGLKSFLDK